MSKVFPKLLSCPACLNHPVLCKILVRDKKQLQRQGGKYTAFTSFRKQSCGCLPPVIQSGAQVVCVWSHCIRESISSLNYHQWLSETNFHFLRTYAWTSDPSILSIIPYSYCSWNAASPYKSLITKPSDSSDLLFPFTSKSHASFWRVGLHFQLTCR
jgi:hypothetical protein